MRLVERHLVGEPGGAAGCSDAELAHAAQIIVAQFVEPVAVVAHPQLGERLGIGERAVEHARHDAGDLVDQGQFVAGRDARMRRQRLLDQRRAGAGKAEDEDRLRRPRRARRRAAGCDSRPAVKKPFSRSTSCLRLLGQIAVAARSRGPCACPPRRRRTLRRSGPSGRAARPFSSSSFAAQAVGAAAAARSRRAVASASVVVVARGRAAPRARAGSARSSGKRVSARSSSSAAALEIAVGLLHPRPAEQGLRHVGRQRRRIPRRAARASSIRPWFFRFQARLASRIGSRVPDSSQHRAVMVLADLRPVRLGQDHADQIVRLRILRGEAHRVAGVHFGLGQAALAEQQQAELDASPRGRWGRARRSGATSASAAAPAARPCGSGRAAAARRAGPAPVPARSRHSCLGAFELPSRYA